LEYNSGKYEQAVKRWIIAVSAGSHYAIMKKLILSRELIDSTLTAYNNSCTEMRSEARDKYISKLTGEWGVNDHCASFSPNHIKPTFAATRLIVVHTRSLGSLACSSRLS
jgi:hypothetical protein